TFGIGGGIYNQYQTADIVNTILWGNTATSNPQAYPTPDGNNGYSYCCCPTVTNCPTCQTINPLFVGSGNYMITYGSSCYESGDNNVQHEAFDLNGNSRICHNVIDIGAYEDPYIYKSGDICDQTWTNHNPNGIDYVITDNITVRCTLTIQNGTTIAFEDGKKMDVQGSLDAQGNSLNYITFTAINPNNGWGGIRFNGTSSQYSSEFDYCILEYSKKSDPPTPYGYCQCGIFTAYYNGGAIYLKDFGNIDISNSIFRYNFASRGGAIYVYSSNASVIEPSISNNNEFYQNESCKGGAICLQGNENNKFKLQADINYNTFHDNFSMRLGGAVFTDIYDNSEITGNTFNNNEADIEDNFSKGGAVLFCGGSKNQFKNNTLYNNTAKTGGALCVNYGTAFTGTDPVIEGNSIYSNNAVNGGGVAFISSTKLSAYNTKFYSNKVYENEAYRDGGGIYIKGFSPIIYNSLIVNNTSTDDGGGIYDTNSVSKYYNCTIADNNADEGGGVYSPDITSFPEFRNDIIYDNLPDDVIFNNSPPDVGDPYYNYCDIGNFTFNQSGPSNFSADPKFVDGYHLKYGNPAPPYTSPCINSGDPNFTPPTNYDLDNNTRVADGRIDMGCYENDGSNQNWWIVFNNINDDEHNDLSINVYPNPVDDQLTLKIDSKIDNNFTIQMYNSLGKIEYNEHRDIKIGENIIYLNRNQLAAGIYYLKVSSAFINLKVMKIIFK
ncbi:MAG: T9SS type A sorting domain-containing protein, partial [Bacteroidota bacterium]|nr:T9SS type A sorting domain-containing protein [Bacteroidota bacterium]